MKRLLEPEECVGKVVTDVEWTEDSVAVHFGDEALAYHFEVDTDDDDARWGGALLEDARVVHYEEAHALGLITREEYDAARARYVEERSKNSEKSEREMLARLLAKYPDVRGGDPEKSALVG